MSTIDKSGSIHGSDGKFTGHVGDQPTAGLPGANPNDDPYSDRPRPVSSAEHAINDRLEALQKATWALELQQAQIHAKSAAESVLERFPNAHRISYDILEQDTAGEIWNPQSVMDAEGNVLVDSVEDLEYGSDSSVHSRLHDVNIPLHSGLVGFTEYRQLSSPDGSDGYLDLKAASELDISEPALMRDPETRVLTRSEQATLVYDAATGYEQAYEEMLHNDAGNTMEDFSESLVYNARGYALTVPRNPGESTEGSAARIIVERYASVSAAEFTRDANGKMKLSGGKDRRDNDLTDAQIEEENSEGYLHHQFNRLDLDELDDETLAASGITRTERGYSID